MPEDDDIAQGAQDALETAIEDASQKAAAEASASARADEKQAALESRLAALESRGSDAPAFDPSTITQSIESVLGGAIAPIVERLDRLESSKTETASVQASAEPTQESDPFTPQIDYSALASKSVEKMPKISHPLFRRVLGRR